MAKVKTCDDKKHQDSKYYWTEQEIKEDFYFEARDDVEFYIDEDRWAIEPCGIHYIQET